jgi:antitoxin component of RelBE/YafQ-DinJ toxin-antitoxin module
MPAKLVTEKALPFEVRVPNTTTVKALRSADKKQGKRFRLAKKLFEELSVQACERAT